MRTLREEQELFVRDVERQLAEGADPVVIAGGFFTREAAWAATASIRKAWELDALYDGVQKEGRGWCARVLVPIGEFPG